MYHYAGIDVSLECSSICLVDGTGKILREVKVASEPEALIAWFGSLGLVLEHPIRRRPSRRSRTEASAERVDDAKKGLTNQGPLQKPG